MHAQLHLSERLSYRNCTENPQYTVCIFAHILLEIGSYFSFGEHTVVITSTWPAEMLIQGNDNLCFRVKILD